VRIRSIRLSLTVYFLALLAVALGVASIIVYQTAQQTLEDKKKADAQLIENHLNENSAAVREALDKQLQEQAQALAGVAMVQFLHHRELNVLGVLAAATAPNAYAVIPSWAGQGTHGPYFFELNRKHVSEITFDQSHLFETVSQSDIQFQIDSAWGASYRSLSLGDRSFALDPRVFMMEPEGSWRFTDDYLDGPARRVTFKTSVPIAPAASPGRGDLNRPDRFRRPPVPSREFQNRTAVFIQCVAPADKREAALAALAERRDHDLAALAVKTDASLANLRSRLLLTWAALFLVAGVGCYLLVRLGLAPLHRLSEAVRRVSTKDFRLQVDQRRIPNELNPIVRRMSETLQMLKRTFEREKQATADISHELRTPLAAMLTTTEIALRKPRTADEYRELLADCRNSAQHMAQAVERLLALARLDAGVDRLRPQEFDAAELAEQCGALVRPLAEARGLTLTVHRTGPAPVMADPDKLREILTNLLHNAVEYNRSNGAIDVSVSRENGQLEVSIEDTGVGIGPEAKSHLFERFYRADPSRAGDGLHAGLGLAIVKGYVDLMGGDIAVESTEGQGSTFRIRLPAH